MSCTKLKAEEILQEIEEAVVKNFKSQDIITIHEELRNFLPRIIHHLIFFFFSNLEKYRPQKFKKSKVNSSLTARFQWKLVVRKNFEYFKNICQFENRPLDAQNNFLLLLTLYSEQVFFAWCEKRRGQAKVISKEQSHSVSNMINLLNLDKY